MKIEKRGMMIPFSFEQLLGPIGNGHSELKRYGRWYLLRRRLFIALWQRIERRGFRKGYLESDSEGGTIASECSGVVKWVSE